MDRIKPTPLERIQMASASSTATSFLDNYLDVLKPLPTEFYRNLALMQKLDSLGERMFNLLLPPPFLFEAPLSSKLACVHVEMHLKIGFISILRNKAAYD
jgi:hypothetical protein